jgi:hypothetical protein
VSARFRGCPVPEVIEELVNDLRAGRLCPGTLRDGMDYLMSRSAAQATERVTWPNWMGEHPRANCAWTDAEDDILMRYYRQYNANCATLMKRHGRNQGAIESRIAKLLGLRTAERVWTHQPNPHRVENIAETPMGTGIRLNDRETDKLRRALDNDVSANALPASYRRQEFQARARCIWIGYGLEATLGDRFTLLVPERVLVKSTAERVRS